ncbi:MAG: PAS domain S-box protein [Hydrogenophaga sp.]
MIIGGATVGGLLVGYLSYQRSVQQTIVESQEWASALGSLVARSSISPLMEQNFATVELTVREVAAMPGVVSIQVVRPGGALVMRTARAPDGKIFSEFVRGQQIAPPSQREFFEDGLIHIYTPLLKQGSAPPTTQWEESGWINLTFSYSQRMQHALNSWTTGAALTIALVTLALVIMYRFLKRTTDPIRQLAAYANDLTKEPGRALRMRWGSTEVRELGRALNWASSELARQIEQSLQRVSRLRAILDTAADAIIGVSPDGIIDSANPAAERMFGRQAADILGQPLSVFLEGMDAAALRQAMADGMLIYSTQTRIGRLELNALRHGGTPFPIEVLLGEIPNDPEIRYTCIVRDLSDTKISEEYLTLYGRVLDCTLNGISISDARRYPQPIVHVNPAYTRITGYAAHEVLGRDAGLLEGPLTDKTDLALLTRAVQSGSEMTITLKNYRKDGSVFHNKLSVSPVRDSTGEISHYINVIEDVSGQIEVKQRLMERTARLNATFDLSPDGFAVFDGAGELITSNPALRQMTGDIPSLCSLQRFDAWFCTLCEDGDNYRPIFDAMDDMAKDTMVLARPKHRVLEREIRRNQGGSGETFLYFRDITHQFEVDRMKSEFLATAAHELRTPLASILGFTELMIHRSYSDEKRKDLLQTVHRQGTLLSNLIQELLDLSRIEARQGKDFHIQPTPLATVVNNAVQSIAGRDPNRPVTVGAIPDISVMADASKFEQALLNLLSNAIKYSPQGGEVRLDFEQRETQGIPMMGIKVKDHGLGMSPDQLERAFERFYRADASGNIPGTGLGLNLVKEIAEIQGGSIELESTLGVGTTATLWLRNSSVLEAEAEQAI